MSEDDKSPFDELYDRCVELTEQNKQLVEALKKIAMCDWDFTCPDCNQIARVALDAAKGDE